MEETIEYAKDLIKDESWKKYIAVEHIYQHLLNHRRERKQELEQLNELIPKIYGIIQKTNKEDFKNGN